MIYLIFIYFIIMIGITLLFTKRSKTNEDFLVGDRKTGTLVGALSIASTWIWAPALLVSAEQGYKWGWYGLFWFLIPNILCLIFFIPFAKKIREQYKNGYSLSGFMELKHGKKTGKFYKYLLSTVSILSTSVQLLAGAMIINMISGVSFFIATLMLAFIVFSYSLYSGIKASMITDSLQMIIMIIFSITIVYTTGSTYGLSQFNLSGATEFTKMGVFLSFGLSTTIGLIAGPFGDQSFWQRAFSIDKKKLGKSFGLGALMFAIVPLSMGLIGMAARGVENFGTANLEFINTMLPKGFMVMFIFILLSGLMSTLDSNLCAFASLHSKDNLRKGRLSMIVLLLFGIGIANIPNLTVTKLFMIYGSVRSITLIPTILTLNKKKLTPKYINIGIIAGLIIGLPIFAVGTIKGITPMIVVGSLLSLLLPGGISYYGRRK